MIDRGRGHVEGWEDGDRSHRITGVSRRSVGPIKKKFLDVMAFSAARRCRGGWQPTWPTRRTFGATKSARRSMRANPKSWPISIGSMHMVKAAGLETMSSPFARWSGWEKRCPERAKTLLDWHKNAPQGQASVPVDKYRCLTSSWYPNLDCGRL